MTPNLGPGACQAIEDAMVLARWLIEGGAISDALRRYERLRSERAAMVVRQGLGGAKSASFAQGTASCELFLRSSFFGFRSLGLAYAHKGLVGNKKLLVGLQTETPARRS